jgi:MFS family permease
MAPCSHGIIGDSFPRAALAKPLAMQGIGFQVGSAAGVAAAGAVLAAGAAGAFLGWPVVGDMAPWRVALIAIGLPGLLAIALIAWLHDPKEARSGPSAQAQRAEQPFLPFVRNNRILVALALLMSGVSAIGLGCVTAWIPEYLQRVHHVSPMQTGAKLGGLLLFAAFVGQGGYAVITDWLAARGVRDSALRVGMVPAALSVPVAWFAFQAASEADFLRWLTLLLLCIAPGNAISNTTVQLIAPTLLRSRLSAAAILSISIIGFTGGPALVGWLSQYMFGEARLGDALQLVMTASMAVSLLLMFLLRPRLKAYLG